MSGPVEKARAAWGAEIPEWVEALAAECAATSQNRVAKRLGRSATLVSNVLANKYEGDMEAVEDLFSGVFLSARVECPALGLIPINECRQWREKARQFVNVNALRVRMYRACVNCPRNRKEPPNEPRD